MADEIEVAQEVVEQVVATTVAKSEAVAASGAAIAAEGAAADALEAAREAEALAARAVDRATIDAEERIRKFEEEMASCRLEIQNLKTMLENSTAELAAFNLSTSTRLTQLAALEATLATMTEEERLALAARRSAMLSGTDGNTKGPDGGETSQPEPKKGEREKQNPKPGGREASEETKGTKAPPREGGKHRWL